jgi:hypothetical protein
MTRGPKVLLLVLVLMLVGSLAFFFIGRKQKHRTSSFAPKKACPQLLSPVDVSQVTAILYPGQTRGGHYKAHGGFRLDKPENNVIVKAPMDATLMAASRYIEIGEVQYLFDFKTACGLEYRFDHFAKLSPKLQDVVEKLPAAEEGNSKTHNVRGVSVAAGEVLATAVGFTQGEHGPNVSFDFGLYDRRQKNEASKNPDWAKAHKENSDQTYHAVCWLDWLPTADAAIVKSLPGGDYVSGKQSDYCQ